MSADLETLRRRSELLRAARTFFYRQQFIEIESPVRIPANAPEEFIEAIPAGGGFLRTSPELALKVLLSRGAERIFEIGSAFRAGEFGSRHREEFTILEYYAVGWDYRRLARFTARLAAQLARRVTGGCEVLWRGRKLDFSRSEFITVDEAYRRYAGVSAFDTDADGSFDELMVTKVEPELGAEGLTFLIDYPASRASLSRRRADDPRVAERWELYAAGVELGNAFGELTDSVEQRERFRAAAEFRAGQGMLAYPEAEEFLAALDRGIPDSSGCALGFDRLAMLLLGADDIGAVRL